MEQKFISNLQETENLLKEFQIQYTKHSHKQAQTMEELMSVVKFEKSPYIKNLMYIDKKHQYYMVLAKSDTQVGKGFWQKAGTSGGNIRLAQEDQMQKLIKVQRGNINPFALINDKEDKIKLIIDQKLMEYENWAFHPMDNTASLELNKDEILKKYLEKIGKTKYLTLNLEGEAESQGQPKQKQQQNVEEVKSQSLNKDTKGIGVQKMKDLSQWYYEVLIKSEMLEYYDISGCYILRPWSYFIWETLQKYLDDLFKTQDVENAYFPIFVSKKALEAEKEHVEGFSPEVAWVTKSGQSDLAEPIAIRPTSETIMYPAYAKWVQSHRDLPIKLNQWTNIVRWEFKHPTPFIRTREFLWQEGHTAHSSKKEADDQTLSILEFYKQTYEEMLAIPVIKGKKSELEKFPGGDYTTTVETMIPENGRAVQGATSHYLGQNFAKMANIQFENINKEKEFAYQTSWGFTTRSIGVCVLFHGDDKGLVLPPRVAKVQVVIIPIFFKDGDVAICKQKSQEIGTILKSKGIRVVVDDDDHYNPGWKYNHWELKGVPIRIEVGPKDVQQNEVRVVIRHDGSKKQLKQDNIAEQIKDLLEEIQKQMLQKAKQKLQDKQKKAENWQDFMQSLNKRNMVFTPWCQCNECEESVKEKSAKESINDPTEATLTGACKTLCIPFEQPELKEGTKCFNCGKEAKCYVYWGRSY